MSLLHELPTAVLHSIALYIPDGVTLCHFESTCCNLRAAVTSTKDPWNTLYCQRWSFRGGETQFDKRAYATRHLKDQKATNLYEIILQRAAATANSGDSSLNDDTHDKELRGLFALGKEIIDLFWEFHDQATTDKDRERTKTLLTYLQFSALFTEIVHCIHLQLPQSSAIRIEEYAILTSILGSGTTHRNFDQFAREAIRDPLEDMAETVRRRLMEKSGKTSHTTQQIFQTLNEVFFREQGFSGNAEDYYDFDNSMLHATLQRKKAIPMTLAILYKCVARRMDIEVDIIGLPGKIVVGVPVLGCHVDVFNGGRVLQRADLARICDSYGFSFREELLTPLTPEDTLARMAKNMMNCIAHERGDATEADETSSLRLLMVILIGMALRESNRTTMIIEKCQMGLLRRWDRQYGRVVE